MDSVTFDARIEDISSLHVSADAKVMQNYQAALPVAANTTIAATEDASGNPMVFSIGLDKHLYLIMADPGGATGWKQVDLTPSLARWGAPLAFAVGQVPGGNITLAVAAAPAGGSPTIVVAGPLSNDPAQTDWTKLDDLWVTAGNPQPGASVDALYVGPVDATGSYGIPLIAVGFSGGTPSKPNTYLLRPAVTNVGLSWSWVGFPTPTDSSDILDYAMGSIGDLGQGVYMLYENTLGQSLLIFKTLPDPVYGRSYDRELLAPQGATCLETTPGSGGTTELFVAGTGGVYHFSPENQRDRASAVGIASSQDVPDVREDGLIVRKDAGGVTAVWALSGEALMYFQSSSTEPGGYGKPVLFEPGVAEIAPVRSQQKRANQLVFVKTDVASNPSIVWMWQDPTSSLWQRDLIPLADTGNTLQFNCYTTTLAFTDPKNQAVAGLALEVSASGWVRAVINGVSHILDIDSPARVTTDLTGNLTIINPVADLATPQFTVRAADPSQFAGALVVDPAHDVYTKLAQVKSGGDIPDYVLQRALPQGVSKDDVAQAIQKLMQFQPDPAPQPSTIVYQAAGATTSAATPKAKVAVPSSFTRWGLSFEGGGMKLLDAQALAARPRTVTLSVVGEVWDDVTNVVGDLWQFATSVIDKVVAITVDVVKDVLTFVVTLVDKTIQIVIQTIQDVFKAITFILQKLEAVFESIIRWLGFLFDWKDMWDAHRVIANFVNSGLDYAVGRLGAEVDVWKRGIAGFFDHVKTDIHNLLLPDSVANADLASQEAQAQATSPQASVNSAPVNWTLYQVQHGGVTSGTTDAQPPAAGNPLVQFFQDVVAPTVQGLESDIERLFQDIAALFKGNPTVAAFLTVVNDFIDLFLDALENILLGFLDFAVDMVVDMKALITMPLEIPFFSNLYRFVTKLLGAEEPLTINNVLSLAVAVPTTILYKLLTNESPFPNGIDALLQPDVFAQMLGGAPAKKTLVLAETSDQGEPAVDKGSFSYIYTHYVGLVGSILTPISSILSFVTLDKKLKQEGFYDGASAPLTEEGKKNLARNIGYLELITLGCDVGSLAATYPVPKGENATSDKLSYAIWGVGWWRLFGGVLIPRIPKIPSKAEKLLSAGSDAISSLAQLGMLMAVDVYDGADALKYCQDILSAGGAIVSDIGTAATVVPSASVKVVANAARAGGIALGMIASGLEMGRVVIDADEQVLRTQIV